MKKKIYSPKEVLLAVIEHYANVHSDNINEYVEASFLEDDGSIELTITLEDDNVIDLEEIKSKKKSLN